MKKLTFTVGLMALMAVSVKANPGYFLFLNLSGDKIFNTNEMASATNNSSLTSNAYPSLRIAIYYSTNTIATNLTDRRAHVWPNNTNGGITGYALFTNTSGIIGFNSNPAFNGRFSGGSTSNTAYKVEMAITNQFQVRIWDNTYGATWEAFKSNMDVGNVPAGILYGLSPLFYLQPSDSAQTPIPNPPSPIDVMPFWNLTNVVVLSPVITTQPQSQVRVPGTTASFSVAATGTAPLGYRWRFNNTNLVWATNSTLTLNNVQSVNAGYYQVIVSNTAGTVTSTVATLTVVYPPAITGQPQSQTCAAGTMASFNVTATGTAPLAYQWYKSVISQQSAVISGATNSAFSLQPLALGDAGSYYCVVSNAYGAATSSVASLTLLVYPPVITGQPQNQTNRLGTTALFNVTASSLIPLSYQWMRVGASFPIATTSQLTIPMVQATDAGSYYCVVSTADGRVVSKLATLTVLSPPVITVQPQSQSNPLGAPVSFTSVAVGTSPLAYQWYKAVTSNQSPVISGATNSVYRLTAVAALDAGSYYCVVSNVYGMATSAVASLTLLYAPAILTQPDHQLAPLGAPAYFKVTAAGFEPLGYQWYKAVTSSNQSPVVSGQWSVVSGQWSHEFSLQPLALGDVGSYYCVVSNAYGMATSAVATLTLAYSPVITGQPQNQTNVLGTAASFSVTGVGTAPLAYQWFRSVTSHQSSVISGATNSAFSLQPLALVHAGSYYCVVRNGYGMATSAVATLTVLCPPTITTQPQSQMNVQGTTVSFNVTAAGTAPLAYQWFRSVTSNQNQLSVTSGATNSAFSLQPLALGHAGNYYCVVSNAYGVATSRMATLTVLSAPIITTQPQSVTNGLGAVARFNVVADGTGPLTYQWFRSVISDQLSVISGATNSAFSLPPLALGDAGDYQVVVANSFGSVTSLVATLTVVDNLGPLITVNGTLGQTVNQRLYSLSGVVTDAGRGNHGVRNLWVNGLAVTNVSAVDDAVAPWSQVLTLQPGMNYGYVLAADALGNRSTNLFYINFVPTDSGLPTVMISQPASPTYSNLVMVSGTASDAKGVVEVWCQQNDGPWMLASGANKWSIQLVPTLGTNTLAAYAVDASGNYSKTNRVKFVKLATDTLTVTRVGNGTLSPDLNGKVLTLGSPYSMKSLPGTGFLFSNWVGNGSVLTNNPSLLFTMRSNLTLTANFVPNAFLARKGDYAGLFCPSNDVFQADWTNSGAVKLTMTDKGAFSGQLTYQGKVYPLAGAFDVSGVATANIARGNDPALQVWLNLDLNAGGGMTGTINQGTNWSSALRAGLVLKQAQVKTSYSVAVVLDPTGTNVGTLNLSVQPSGLVTLTGTLADGTKLTGSLPLTTKHEVVLYQTLYVGKGLWLGYLSLANPNPNGTAHWQKLENGFSVNARLLLP
ncbi:MAG: immunoglobulin domain-containing protein [Verrucomicrobiota bacterium]